MAKSRKKRKARSRPRRKNPIGNRYRSRRARNSIKMPRVRLGDVSGFVAAGVGGVATQRLTGWLTTRVPFVARIPLAQTPIGRMMFQVVTAGIAAWIARRVATQPIADGILKGGVVVAAQQIGNMLLGPPTPVAPGLPMAAYTDAQMRLAGMGAYTDARGLGQAALPAPAGAEEIIVPAPLPMAASQSGPPDSALTGDSV